MTTPSTLNAEVVQNSLLVDAQKKWDAFRKAPRQYNAHLLMSVCVTFKMILILLSSCCAVGLELHYASQSPYLYLYEFGSALETVAESDSMPFHLQLSSVKMYHILMIYTSRMQICEALLCLIFLFCVCRNYPSRSTLLKVCFHAAFVLMGAFLILAFFCHVGVGFILNSGQLKSEVDEMFLKVLNQKVSAFEDFEKIFTCCGVLKRDNNEYIEVTVCLLQEKAVACNVVVTEHFIGGFNCFFMGICNVFALAFYFWTVSVILRKTMKEVITAEQGVSSDTAEALPLNDMPHGRSDERQ